MAAKKKQAKFFCEYCDSEVPLNAKFCPKCGHFFLAVRCPACGKTGSHEEFEHGCPQCGYAFDGSPVKQFAAKKTERDFISYTDTISKRKRKNDDALPLWVYLMTFTVFAGIIIFIITQCHT